ncbi:hypothetical protein JW916_09820 [Candidatus Sumerlaeota bacterium]|nr:hypothetical protein [Candidatus Sumerlaeota bacterium]
MESAPHPTPSGTSRLKKRRRRQSAARARTAWLIGAIVLVFVAGIFLSGGGIEFVRSLYSPVALIVVIFLIVEYVVLKGRDRSRLYRIELDQMREKRRRDNEFLHDIERDIQSVENDLASLEDRFESGDDRGQELRRLRSKFEDLRRAADRRC